MFDALPDLSFQAWGSLVANSAYWQALSPGVQDLSPGVQDLSPGVHDLSPGVIRTEVASGRPSTGGSAPPTVSRSLSSQGSATKMTRRYD